MNEFYLKLTETQANQLINQGIDSLLGSAPTKFTNYTYYVEDVETGDKYWKIENTQYDGTFYDVIGFLDQYFPDLTHYTQEHVDQFVSEEID